MISSTSGKQIKNIISLQNKAGFRYESGQYVVEGLRICNEIPKDMLVKAYISESFHSKMKSGDIVCDICEYEIVKDSVFKEIALTKTPQGILAVVKQPRYNLSNMLDRKKCTLIFLDDVRDPGNLGTIIRTAEGANIDGIVMSKGTVDAFNPKVIRSTMGAIYRMPFVYVDDLSEAIAQAKQSGVSFYAAHLKGTDDYAAIRYPDKRAVVIGNEANGISDDVTDMCDMLVKIPMTGDVESLNASVAAAVLMYELYRQSRF